MSFIRTLLVDDHQMVRQGIRTLLEQNETIEVVGEATNADEAISAIGELAPNIILLDINLPGMSGLELAPLIRSQFPDVRILVLTVHTEEEYVRGTLLAGADGYLSKNSSVDELFEAIRLVNNNRMYYPRIANGLDNGSSNDKAPVAGTGDTLTVREKEILHHIALGETSRQIAERIFLSVKTVDNYRARILAKLQARNTAEAVMFAVQRGIVTHLADSPAN